jgi:prefoldin subunit 5|tara:strand:- start:488 stop:688 length:201 start_codon:yes stop_codon:yes gene_type:complete
LLSAQFIGEELNMSKKEEIENLEEQTKILFKVVDKLEQRIATLEKVLASHAKCIGEMREDKKDDIN